MQVLVKELFAIYLYFYFVIFQNVSNVTSKFYKEEMPHYSPEILYRDG